jgi:hypothetical protein
VILASRAQRRSRISAQGLEFLPLEIPCPRPHIVSASFWNSREQVISVSVGWISLAARSVEAAGRVCSARESWPVSSISSLFKVFLAPAVRLLFCAVFATDYFSRRRFGKKSRILLIQFLFRSSGIQPRLGFRCLVHREATREHINREQARLTELQYTVNILHEQEQR